MLSLQCLQLTVPSPTCRVIAHISAFDTSTAAPAVFDQRVVDVGAIGEEHIGKGAPILVLAECLQSDFLSVDQL